MGLKRLVENMFREQYGFCAYCFNKMTLKRDLPHSATADHVISKADGGQASSLNLVGACMACNQEKGHLPLTIFLLNRQRKKAGLPPILRDIEREKAKHQKDKSPVPMNFI